jgi:flagellar basal body-associated protein FliL
MTRKTNKKNRDGFEKSLKSDKKNLIFLIIAGLIAMVLGIGCMILIFFAEDNTESDADPTSQKIVDDSKRTFAVVSYITFPS